MADEATEETALLHDQDVSSVHLPLLRDFISRLNSISPGNLLQTDVLQPAQLSNHRALHTSFSVIVLLLFREQKTQKKASQYSPWDDWKHETLTDQWVKTIDESIEQIWTTFLGTFCSSRDVEIALWTEFLVDEKGQAFRGQFFYLSRRFRTYLDLVIDFASKHPKLLNDRVVELALKYRWKRGALLDPSSSRQYLTSRYDVLCTPWIYHAFDLASQIVFLLLLISYVLNPPRPAFSSLPLEYIEYREVLLIVLSIAAILHSWTASMPFTLTLAAFLLNLPSAPLPSESSFNILLLSLVLLVIQLHLPLCPSPFLLIRPERCLPLAALIVHSVFGPIMKILLLFLPVLLLSVLFLSYALSDVFLVSSLVLVPAPMPTRELFFTLAASTFIIILLSVLVLVPISVSYVRGSSWDQYSTSNGQVARAQFYRSVVRYSKPYPFPPPFNILYFVFISVPAQVLPYFDISNSFLFSLEKILWRAIVGPFVVIVRFLTLGLS
ncbi:hypothetical protein EV368DRAFT_79375 [Lentinula lateritia]|nr:hypothetical protein EV368DRAFT_79375 [Lentinula lateritia]